MDPKQPKKKILVVEDEVLLRDALIYKFEEEGFTVTGAADGQAGLEEATQNHPDLILLDIIMPNMDGLTMLDRLRENAWGKTVQVIMLTNLSDMKSTSRAVEKNAKDILVKSDWAIDDVVKKVKEKLGKSSK